MSWNFVYRVCHGQATVSHARPALKPENCYRNCHKRVELPLTIQNIIMLKWRIIGSELAEVEKKSMAKKERAIMQNTAEYVAMRALDPVRSSLIHHLLFVCLNWCR